MARAAVPINARGRATPGTPEKGNLKRDSHPHPCCVRRELAGRNSNESGIVSESGGDAGHCPRVHENLYRIFYILSRLFVSWPTTASPELPLGFVLISVRKPSGRFGAAPYTVIRHSHLSSSELPEPPVAFRRTGLQSLRLQPAREFRSNRTLRGWRRLQRRKGRVQRLCCLLFV